MQTLTKMLIKLNEQGRWLPGRIDKPTEKYGIYILLYKNQIIRIGETASGIERIKRGFQQNKKRKNSSAYSWRLDYKNKNLSLQYFPLVNKYFKKPKIRRALEAELTFQIRVYKKKWPIKMSEIHFLENQRKKKLMLEMLKKILVNYKITYNSEV